MHFFNIGQVGRDLCMQCGDVVDVRYELRPVWLDESEVDVPDVLVAVCAAGHVVSIPSQSEPRLKEARVRAATGKLRARVTRAEADALRMLAEAFDVPHEAFSSRLMTYYLRRIARDPTLAARVRAAAASPLAIGPKGSGIEMRIRESVLERAMSAMGGATQTELVEGVVAVATQDVLERSESSDRVALEHIAMSL